MIPVAPSSSNMWRIYCESSGPKSALLTQGSGKQNNKIRKRKGRKKERRTDLTGGSLVKNPPFNAGKAGLIPGWETKIPRATTRELTHCS